MPEQQLVPAIEQPTTELTFATEPLAYNVPGPPFSINVSGTAMHVVIVCALQGRTPRCLKPCKARRQFLRVNGTQCLEEMGIGDKHACNGEL